MVADLYHQLHLKVSDVDDELKPDDKDEEFDLGGATELEIYQENKIVGGYWVNFIASYFFLLFVPDFCNIYVQDFFRNDLGIELWEGGFVEQLINCT